MPSENDGVMIVLSSPSGAGKTTLVKMLSKTDNYEISISHTTRQPRSNEVDGVDYHFVSHQKFKDLIKKNKFYEHAKIFQNYYGTLKKDVDMKGISNFCLLQQQLLFWLLQWVWQILHIETLVEHCFDESLILKKV